MNIFKKFMLGTVAMFALGSCSDKAKQEEAITPKEKFANFIYHAVTQADSIQHGYTKFATTDQNMETVVNEGNFIQVAIHANSELADEMSAMRDLGEDENSGVPNFDQKGSGIKVQDNNNQQIIITFTKDLYMATQGRDATQTEQDLTSALHQANKPEFESWTKKNTP